MRAREDWCPGGSLLENEKYVCNIQGTLNKQVECPYQTREEMRRRCKIYQEHIGSRIKLVDGMECPR